MRLGCDLDCGIDVAKGHLYILNLNGKEGFVELIFVYVLPIFVLYYVLLEFIYVIIQIVLRVAVVVEGLQFLQI